MSTSTHNNGLWSPSDMRASEEHVEGAPAQITAMQGGWLKFLLGSFTVQDVILLVYLTVVRVLLAQRQATADQASCARTTELCIGVVLGAVLIGRVIPGIPPLVRKIVYRVSIVGVLLQNYLVLRWLLPVVRPDSVDGTLLRIDEAIFGREPALMLEAFNVRPVVEWFSFFYFSYFFIGATYMIVSVWLTKPSRRTTAFAIGTLLVFGIGQLGYMAVPGYGPHQYLAQQFKGPIDGGFFWGCVWDTVQAGSAMKDIFPSLHTAVPTWFTLHALHNAKTDRRWLWPAIVTGFFAANIIFSTVFLRWHYAIDVLAGLTLAFTAGTLAPLIARREEEWRLARGLRGAWVFD
ncbi:phosphatase PAP2 family protein [Polyangium sp. 15x6]|uniref:phosphatase PAP2 family protein n=1 Tax=Polyangium sp. 15x6 TaxID=3042687 RepID=UPI00249B859C|nr:phosphatase PAP2 family protein [Polyangium sp. 15x6]MDI3286972.1 phosphatase PAP2 family protein [Polyangium sp. 15x6]